MESKKQTAVDWLFDQYKLVGMLTTAQVEKAKAMEKEQKKEAYIFGRNNGEMKSELNFNDFLQTYNTDKP